jgi:RNA polymerase sigma factor (TIGR02999 family)
MVPEQSGDVTKLLNAIAGGQRASADQLVPLVYDELRRLADHYLQREQPGHTLSPTALVHEAYLKLVDQKRANWMDRAHFFAVAAQAMRRILVDYARRRRTLKRGGNGVVIQNEMDMLEPLEQRAIDLVALNEAMNRLSAFDAQANRIVELRFFGGLGVEETAKVMGVSDRTVRRGWDLARTWLRAELADR